VRIIGVPDLRGLSPKQRGESLQGSQPPPPRFQPQRRAFKHYRATAGSRAELSTSPKNIQSYFRDARSKKTTASRAQKPSRRQAGNRNFPRPQSSLTGRADDARSALLRIMKGKFMKRRTVHEKATLMISAWRARCPDKTFFRMSLEDFSVIVGPCGAARERVASLKAQLREAKQQCEEADRIARRAIVRVVNGVKGDPDEGEDGELLGAMGYMKHTVRSELLSEARRRSARAATAGTADSTT
jgi:hypothetical protein